jgi:uncharacterized SAM-binding protein YcdF (DUF218 family)
LRILSLALLLFFTNGFILDEFMRSWETTAVRDDKIGNHDVGIVLGGMLSYDMRNDRVQFHRQGDRLFQAIRLYRQGRIRKILVTSGNGFLTDQLPESPIAVRYLKEIGIPEGDVIVEDASRNTHENAKYSKPLLDSIAPGGKYLLITSGIHMKRAMACFKREGLQCQPFSADRYCGPRKFMADHMFLPNSAALWQWNAFLHEVIGYVMYRMAGYV